MVIILTCFGQDCGCCHLSVTSAHNWPEVTCLVLTIKHQNLHIHRVAHIVRKTAKQSHPKDIQFSLFSCSPVNFPLQSSNSSHHLKF